MTTREIEIEGHQYTVLEQEDVCDSKWLTTEAHPHSFPLTSKDVIELSAESTGLPGLMAARLRACHVVLTNVVLILPGPRSKMEADGAEARGKVLQ
ncbi:hypothetical protein ACJRO7_019391 [Eucalyptus globulus]|uniref:Uncharacterized protein n=1 Tax=Eucalyptus globulus TaxID=34317 RepID=A0ABD3KEW3_EUCGL